MDFVTAVNLKISNPPYFLMFRIHILDIDESKSSLLKYEWFHKTNQITFVNNFALNRGLKFKQDYELIVGAVCNGGNLISA